MSESPLPVAQYALVFGATGQIGAAVVTLLLRRGWHVVAVSRQPQASGIQGLTWIQGELTGLGEIPGEFDAVVSCGPLDHFSTWYARSGCRSPRVIAFGSTSLLVKSESIDPAEQDLAYRLGAAEQLLFAQAETRACALTVLRPTLVWGAGMDRSLTRMATLAARLGHFALPAASLGRRHPVHVADLAQAVLQLFNCPASHGQAYALGGGEILTYRQMVRRVMDALPVKARLWILPTAVFGVVAAFGRRMGWLSGFTPAVLDRMQQDLVFDLTPAQRDFGYAPRGFHPTAAELGLAQ